MSPTRGLAATEYGIASHQGARGFHGGFARTASGSGSVSGAGIANGSAGFAQDAFSIDGTLDVTNTTNSFVSASAAVTITHDLGLLGGWQFRREQKAAGSQTVNEALVLSDLIPFVYGTPFDLHFRLQIGTGVVNGPSQNFTTNADFLSTVSVLELSVFHANEAPVSRVSITGDGGTAYPGSTIPEPGALALLASAGLALHSARKRA